MGPHLKKSQSLRLLPKKTFDSLRAHGGKARADIRQHIPKFYSMRLHRRDRAKGKEDAKDILLERLPEVCKGHSDRSVVDQRETTLSEAESLGSPDRKSKSLPPTPAPRKHSMSKVVKHTYQNVPIPITPNSQEVSSFKVSVFNRSVVNICIIFTDKV